MTRDELLAAGHAALASLYQAALYNGTTYADANGPRWLEQSRAALQARLDEPPAPNPAYATPEMTAALLVLAVHNTDTYRTLMSYVCGVDDDKTPPSLRSDGDPGTVGGLTVLDNVVSLLNDDHDYALDTRDGVMVIRSQDDIKPWVDGLNPKKLLDAIMPLVESMPPPDAGAPGPRA